MANFDIIEQQGLRLVKVTLRNETVRTESGAMYYIRGNITMQSKAPSASGFLKSILLAPIPYWEVMLLRQIKGTTPKTAS